MNIYQFLSKKESCIKMTYPILNMIAFVKVFNYIQSKQDQVEYIVLNQSKMKLLQKKMNNDIFDQKNIYKKIVQSNTIFNKKIVVDNNISEQIIFFKAKNNETNNVKLFIGIF